MVLEYFNKLMYQLFSLSPFSKSPLNFQLEKAKQKVNLKYTDKKEVWNYNIFPFTSEVIRITNLNILFIGNLF